MQTPQPNDAFLSPVTITVPAIELPVDVLSEDASESVTPAEGVGIVDTPTESKDSDHEPKAESETKLDRAESEPQHVCDPKGRN
jgi:hypothetical protein